MKCNVRAVWLEEESCDVLLCQRCDQVFGPLLEYPPHSEREWFDPCDGSWTLLSVLDKEGHDSMSAENIRQSWQEWIRFKREELEDEARKTEETRDMLRKQGYPWHC